MYNFSGGADCRELYQNFFFHLLQLEVANSELLNETRAVAAEERKLEDARSEINHLTHRIIALERELTEKKEQVSEIPSHKWITRKSALKIKV